MFNFQGITICSWGVTLQHITVRLRYYQSRW